MRRNLIVALVNPPVFRACRAFGRDRAFGQEV
jgi:hypothetical protein